MSRLRFSRAAASISSVTSSSVGSGSRPCPPSGEATLRSSSSSEQRLSSSSLVGGPSEPSSRCTEDATSPASSSRLPQLLPLLPLPHRCPRGSCVLSLGLHVRQSCKVSRREGPTPGTPPMSSRQLNPPWSFRAATMASAVARHTPATCARSPMVQVLTSTRASPPSWDSSADIGSPARLGRHLAAWTHQTRTN
uniref:Uncharacterized protein n=1 Tax=Ixodes ricinus TaxID=34613 RepID=A0A6B0V0G2_IXORI